MSSKNPFKDRFSEYLTRKIPQDKKESLFKGQFSGPSSSPSSNHIILSASNSPTIAFPASNTTQYLSTPASRHSNQSIDSSKFEFSKYNSSREKCMEDSTQRKRLKKLRQLQQNQCAICLDQISNRCQLQCRHHFCRDCLLGWLSNTSRCPYCRADVHSYWFKGEEFNVEQKEYEYEGEMEENLDWVCYNCDHTDDGDIVLICDRCEAHACHIACDAALHGVEPPGDWYCHFCR